MPAPPKDNPAPRAPRADRTSTVVTTTIIGLALVGIGTIFWEPIAAIAVGAPAADGVSDTHPVSNLPATTNSTDAGAPADASGNS
ncbi:MAG TPA: hypothetical protein VHJ20_22120 [Polyangia bacterium]|nr:hypothetical protein [Polyangia bacterium]